MKKLLYTLIAITTLAQCRNMELPPHLQENKPLLEVATPTVPPIAVLIGLMQQNQPLQPTATIPTIPALLMNQAQPSREQLVMFIRPTIVSFTQLPNINNQ